MEVPYNYHILNVKLTNKGLGAVIRASGLTTEQSDRYDVLMTTSGNRSELFGEDVYGVSGGEYTDYDIPGEALTDERFRRMITEAEKYLGYPYVWGGSNPSTSFDCSGFVSWVINHSGNGWSVGRLGAKGLKGICDIIPPDQAKPGGVSFRRAAETSIKYMLCSRCVEDPESCFEPEDFMDVFDFNTQAASNVLGAAVSEALRDKVIYASSKPAVTWVNLTEDCAPLLSGGFREHASLCGGHHQKPGKAA